MIGNLRRYGAVKAAAFSQSVLQIHFKGFGVVGKVKHTYDMHPLNGRVCRAWQKISVITSIN